MNKTLFVANWKENKTAAEAIEWLKTFDLQADKINFEKKDIVICPSFTVLTHCFSHIKENNFPIVLGAQNISSFEEGAYTGEVSARQVSEFAKYVIIGHSERRKNFGETDKDVKKKVDLAKQAGLTTIVCVQNENTAIPQNCDIIAYEPVFAIGTGNPDTPERIAKVFFGISEKTGKNYLLYGGSVYPSNIENFLKVPLLSGFLVGGSSLDPYIFANLLLKC